MLNSDSEVRTDYLDIFSEGHFSQQSTVSGEAIDCFRAPKETCEVNRDWKGCGKWGETYKGLGGGFNDFYVHPFLGKWSNLTNIFEKGLKPID